MLAALPPPYSVAVGLAVACVQAVVLSMHSGDLCLRVGAWRTGGRPASTWSRAWISCWTGLQPPVMGQLQPAVSSRLTPHGRVLSFKQTSLHSQGISQLPYLGVVGSSPTGHDVTHKHMCDHIFQSTS